MEIKPDRMISLGYGKYWRSDAIVGLMRIAEDRGPGRRTEVYTATMDEPLVASRSETAILQDMAFATDETLRMEEVREVISDLIGGLNDVPLVLRRMLTSEAYFDADAWIRRLRVLLKVEAADSAAEPQSELFE